MIYDINSNGWERKVRGLFLEKKDNFSIKYQILKDFKTKATLKSLFLREKNTTCLLYYGYNKIFQWKKVRSRDQSKEQSQDDPEKVKE